MKTITTRKATLPAKPSARVAELIRSSKANNTKRSYACQFGMFANWLDGREPSDARLADWIAYRFDAEGAKPATLSLAVAAVGFVCKDYGLHGIVGDITRQALAGIKRQAAQDCLPDPNITRGGQAAPVTWDVAASMAAVAINGGGRYRGLRDGALILMMSDGLLRISEVAALRVADFVIDQSDGSGRLTIRKSKTDQTGRGRVLFIGPPTASAVQKLLAAGDDVLGQRGEARLAADMPIISKTTRTGELVVPPKPVSPTSIARIVKDAAKAAGVNMQRVRGHSLRVGAAVSLASAGASLAELQTAGRWQSPAMPGHYAAGVAAGAGAVARLKYRKSGGGGV